MNSRTTIALMTVLVVFMTAQGCKKAGDKGGDKGESGKTAETAKPGSGAEAAKPGSAAEPAKPAGVELEVTHWWTSGGEAAAVAEFAKAFNATGNKWVDGAIAGSGDTARPVMISRITGGDPMGAT